MPSTFMSLKVLLPFGIFLHRTDVQRIVAQTAAGSYGLWPHRLDCVAVLTPGILIYATALAGEVCLAVDHGVLVKTGTEVRISVRRALGGKDLRQLRLAVEQEYLTLDASEQSVRAVTAKLEAGFLRRFAAMQHE